MSKDKRKKFEKKIYLFLQKTKNQLNFPSKIYDVVFQHMRDIEISYHLCFIMVKLIEFNSYWILEHLAWKYVFDSFRFVPWYLATLLNDRSIGKINQKWVRWTEKNY